MTKQTPQRREWHHFQTDLVGDNSDAPRIPSRQLEVLHQAHPRRLNEPERSRAWSMMLTTSDGRAPHRRSVDAAGRWGRRFGLAVGLLIGILVAELVAIASDAQISVLPLVAGALFGEAAGLISARLFVGWARATSPSAVGGW